MDELQKKFGEVKLQNNGSCKTLKISAKHKNKLDNWSYEGRNHEPVNNLQMEHKTSQVQNCARGTSAETSAIKLDTNKHCETIAPDTVTGVASKSSIDDLEVMSNTEKKRQERRERQKMKKQLKREEKKQQRDEEMRRKRVAPKDQKITLIDQSTMIKLLSKENINSNTKSFSSCINEGFPDFPPLSREKHVRSDSLRKEKSRKVKHATSCKGNEPPTSCVSDEQTTPVSERAADPGDSVSSTAVINSEEIQEKETNIPTESTKLAIKTAEEKTKGKRPKRYQPICVPIGEILKASTKTPAQTSGPHGKHPEEKLRPKNELYGGNILDSDNPERKRGKQREGPKKKKLTALKALVIQGRENRKLEREALKIAESEEQTKEEREQAEKEVYFKFHASYSEKPKGEDHKTNNIGGVSEDERRETCEKNEVPALKEAGKCAEECEELQQVKGENNSETSELDSKCNGSVSMSLTELHDVLKPKLHNRRFREYCDHALTEALRAATVALLADVVKFQDRQFARSPLKAVARRRHVTGLRQVRKYLALRRVRLVVVAPDLEPNAVAGGLDDIVREIKALAKECEVPCLFAVPRNPLGRVLKKNVPVSCVGILNYEGAEAHFHAVLAALEEAREEYQLAEQQTAPEQEPELKDEGEGQKDVNRIVVASLLAKLTDQPGRQSPFLDAIESARNISDSEQDALED